MKLILIHGLEGSSQGMKANYLRNLFPQIRTPDFTGSLAVRMEKLLLILQSPAAESWRIIGSSFGGLMAALAADALPGRIDQLILLAPALVWPDFALQEALRISTPTKIYHGRHDQVIPIDYVRSLAERSFTELQFYPVDDDHALHATVRSLDWPALIG